MTDEDLRSARALIANVMLQTGPNVFSSAAWFREKATTLARILEKSLDEIDRLRALNALAQELETKRVAMLFANRAEIVRLDTLVADMRSTGDETTAQRERDHANRELARIQAERDRMLPVVAAAETWAMEREPRIASAHALSAAVLKMRADRRAPGVANSSCECAARGGKHASFCPAKES